MQPDRKLSSEFSLEPIQDLISYPPLVNDELMIHLRETLYRELGRDVIASEEFKSNPYKFLKHENPFVSIAAKKLIKESE